VSDRLKELQRQRALAQEQQEWLDREIAREMGVAPKSPAPTLVPSQAGTPAVDIEANRIIEQYRSAKPISSQVKQGCFVYFFAAFALVGLGILALYFYGHH